MTTTPPDADRPHHLGARRPRDVSDPSPGGPASVAPDLTQLRAEARAFLRQYHAETRTPGLPARLAGVEAELTRGGTYELTPAELAHGARLAWRNSNKCLGRGYWPALALRDRRHVTDPDEVFAGLVEHLRGAFGGGRIQPTISVFGPGVRILNDQLIRYAGYRGPGGSVVGDPQNADLTDHLRAYGWAGGAGTPFDVLPLAIRAGEQVRLYELPQGAVREVEITHPACPAIASLGLRWHALPVISNLRLEVGGLGFACAPFSGWYLQTEIAARNLADVGRYDQLPAVAAALGLDTRRERDLWRDRALVELNVAVLHSFDTAGVRLSDHHGLSRHFVRFEEREGRAGRAVTGRWSWLVPPLSPATSPVYHRHYQDQVLTPNFFAQERVREEARCPVHEPRRPAPASQGRSPVEREPRAQAVSVNPAVPPSEEKRNEHRHRT